MPSSRNSSSAGTPSRLDTLLATRLSSSSNAPTRNPNSSAVCIRPLLVNGARRGLKKYTLVGRERQRARLVQWREPRLGLVVVGEPRVRRVFEGLGAVHCLHEVREGVGVARRARRQVLE